MKKSRIKGFSLVELAVVLMLLALIATLGVSVSGFLNNFAMKSEMRKMRMACLYLQQSAYSARAEQTMAFDVAKRSYSFDSMTEYLPKGMEFGALPDVCGPPATPHTKIHKPITFTNNCITFYPHGIIQAGTVYCVDRTNSYLYALSCGVNHTSHIRIYTYNGTWQLLL